MSMYTIVYAPRASDEVVVASFDNYDDAKAHMENIKLTHPKAYPHHTLITANDDAAEWLWVDSGIEQGI